MLPISGNLGDRRPQVRFVWEPRVGRGRASVGVAIGSPSAIDSQDLDADQVVDGEESGQPALQGRLALNQPSWVPGQTWEIGVWGYRGRGRINRSRAIAGHRVYDSHAVGLDVRVPISRRLTLQGEAWMGQALADVRGGVGQNLNLVTGREVDSVGGWAELLYQASSIHTIGAGFTLDNPDNDDVTPFTGRTHNRTLYLVNRFNLGNGLTIGVDWMLFQTSFRGLSPGTSNRWNLWARQNF